MFTYSHANTPLGQSECVYYLTYLKKKKKFKNINTRAANNGQQVAGHDDRPNIF